ncbi:MFS transporter [Stutzerimonas balearica]|uniref:MFS transporter n=1 Tax=Stutzerimonas balearica TaxID=74829 RepID=UPI000772E371|nr:MFS transporter [Stutzerimonas balearica]OMG61723.1 MFS transporter [Stutzerimonas balearica]
MTTGNAAPPRLGWRTHGVLALLVVAYASSFIGRQIMSVMIEPIKLEFGVSDTAMGLVSGLSFAAVYALLGLPAGRLADRHSRMRVLAITAALWALATLLCGMATGFVVLALARMLVAATEAPVTPTSLSLIADLYPVQNRSLAISCFTGAPTLSAIIGLSVGAWLVDVHGWRTGFVLIAIPLLFLSLIFGFLVREPQRGRWDGVVAHPDPGERLLQSALTLLRNRPYLLLMSASALTTFSAYAFAMWNTSFLVRSHALSLQHAGILAGVVSGAAMAVGGVFSGWLTDRLSARNRAWLLRIPLLGHLLGLAGLALYLLWPQATWLTVAGLPVPSAMLWAAFSGFFSIWWVAASFNLLTQLVSPWQRATAIALQTVFSTLLGIGLGPLAVGLLSDALASTFGDDSLRYAILIVNVFLLVPMGLLVMLYRSRAYHAAAAPVPAATAALALTEVGA